MRFAKARIRIMGAERLHDGAPYRRGKPNPRARHDPPTDSDRPRLAFLLTGTSFTRAVVAVWLLTMAAAPFLKGVLAGFALAGAAATVRDVLGV